MPRDTGTVTPTIHANANIHSQAERVQHLRFIVLLIGSLEIIDRFLLLLNLNHLDLRL